MYAVFESVQQLPVQRWRLRLGETPGRRLLSRCGRLLPGANLEALPDKTIKNLVVFMRGSKQVLSPERILANRDAQKPSRLADSPLQRLREMVRAQACGYPDNQETETRKRLLDMAPERIPSDVAVCPECGGALCLDACDSVYCECEVTDDTLASLHDGQGWETAVQRVRDWLTTMGQAR